MTNVSRLVMTQGPQLGQTFALDQATHSLGREPMNDIVISDPQISRQHARITRQGQAFVIEDAGSTNGTFVNGVRLKSPHTLEPNDVIGLGDAVTLTYYGPDIAATEKIASKPTAALGPTDYQPQPTPAPAPPPAFTPPPAPAYDSPSTFAPAVQPAEGKKGRRWVWMGCGCLVLLTILACVAVFALDYFELLPDLFYQPFYWLGLDKYLF